MSSAACWGQKSLRSCLEREMCNQVEMWRCQRCTHRDTCVAPSPRTTLPVGSRKGGRLLRPCPTARSANARRNACVCAPSRPPSSTAKGTSVCSAMNLGHRSLRGLVGVKLSILHKFRRVPRDLTSLPLPRVPLHCSDHPVQQEMPAWGVEVQDHNIPRPSHVRPPA